MNTNPLGQSTAYNPHYDNTLLFPIPRAPGRLAAGVDPLLCKGYDCWNCYELSWLGPRGKPEVRTARLVYPADSSHIVESKSLKLYLGSFIMTRFANEEAVIQTIKADLASILGAAWIELELDDGQTVPEFRRIDPLKLIDGLEVDCLDYHPQAALLQARPAFPEQAGQIIELYSHLLKTNCPITGQPDWASVAVSYAGPRVLSEASLLRYIVSYREHGDYHELCCEKIFSDLKMILEPDYLQVKCFFTRRGGIDINPCRFWGRQPEQSWSERYWRQ